MEGTTASADIFYKNGKITIWTYLDGGPWGAGTSLLFWLKDLLLQPPDLIFFETNAYQDFLEALSKCVEGNKSYNKSLEALDELAPFNSRHNTSWSNQKRRPPSAFKYYYTVDFDNEKFSVSTKNRTFTLNFEQVKTLNAKVFQEDAYKFFDSKNIIEGTLI